MCGYKEELQLQPGKIVFGYVYAAGTAHFAAIEEIDVPGLMVSRGRAALEVTFDNKVWNIPAKT